MILVDSAVGSRELLPLIQRCGVHAELANLEYGDFCFDGHGPKGPTTIGVERKALHDMLHCIDDARYAGYQLGGMKQMYGISILAIEGMWKPHDNEGWLMEGFKGGASWGYCRYRARPVMYNKLFRYLLSVSLSGVIITHSRDLLGTAFNVTEMYQYFQKPWHEHTSALEIQSLNLANISGRPSLVKRWAGAIDGIGVKLAEAAERLFKKPIVLARADETEWLKIKGVGIDTARRE